MRPNPLRDHLTSGETAVGAWLTIPSPVSAEAVGQAGFDYVCVDMQHGLVDYSDCVPMLMALASGSSTPVARVPWNTPSYIGKALDAGAMAVIVPMVNSEADCRAAIAACRYAPEGGRSYGPIRALQTEGPDYFDRSNEILCIPMIETVEALSAIDSILDVPGVEAIYVGPSDLSVSLGLGPDYGAPAFHDALDEIVAACERHGVVPGIHATAATARDRRERGFRMITVSADLVSLRARVAADLAAFRGGPDATGDAIY